jgi:hypothetical protein
MAKLLVAIVAFSTLGYLAYWAMYKTKVESAEDRVAHAPKRQLDNVRTKANELEAGDEQRLREMEKKTAE